MGDLNSFDCSWKKMVIAKANNEWISTIRSDRRNLNTVLNSKMDMGHEQVNYSKVKREIEEISGDGYQTEESIPTTQEMDPLSQQEPQKRRRRQGSVPHNESADERSSRLAKMSAYAAQRLANESPEQRMSRLKRMSEYAAKRLAQETSDQRAKRLARMSAYAAKRLASETSEQRQARLARMSAYAARRQAMKKMSSPSTSKDIHSSLNYDP